MVAITHSIDPGGTKSCSVSIIIPNWNGGEVLANCLDSILKHTRGVAFELILIDNGSTDGSREIIENLAQGDHRVAALLNEENLFFAKACNQGFEISRGRYVVIANNDILLNDDAVSTLVDFADTHPEIGVVTPLITGPDGRPQELFRRLPNAAYIIAHYHRLGRALDRALFGRWFQNRYLCRDRDFDRVEEIEQPGASFSLVRRRLLDRLGTLFDERYPLVFNDVDLARRLREAGATGVVVPDIRVVHLGGYSSERLESGVFDRMHFEALFLYFKRNRPLEYPILCCWWPRRWWASRHR